MKKYFFLIKLPLILLYLWSERSWSALDCQPSEPSFFESESPLLWTLKGDFKKINDPNLDYTQKAQATTVGSLVTADSNQVFQITISARGKFRYEECPNRPISIELYDKSQKGEFPFLKTFSKLKIVTICHDKTEYRESEIRKLMKEYTAYKMISHFQGPQLDARLLSLTFLNEDGSIYLQAPGFVLEPKKALAERCETKVRGPTIKRWDDEKKTLVRWFLHKDRTLSPYHYEYDKESELRLELINRFLGNIDFNKDFDHNMIPLISKNPNDLREFIIPYDFDLAQLAGGTYYTSTKSPLQIAKDTKSWLLNTQQIAPMLAGSMADELLAAVPGMGAEIEESPLDLQGKSDLLNWLSAFEAVFKE